MNDRVTALERLDRAIATPDRGVIGVVDEMLAIALEHDLRLSWEGDRCRLQIGDDAGQMYLALAKSVVRAILARIAELCDHRRLGSVTPYRGEGEIAGDAADPIRVAFVNMPQELSLELTPTRHTVTVTSVTRHEGAP